MPVSFISNSAALISSRNLEKNTATVERSLSKISSGQRVFSAEEDAAALAVGSGLKVDISVFRAAQINTASGISMMQIADGSLSQLTEIILRMDQLAMQSISEQISNAERAILDTEFQQMKLEIDRIVGGTEFNGDDLLGGTTVVELNTLGAGIDANEGFVGFKFNPPAVAGDVYEVEYIASTQVLTVQNITAGTYQTIYVDQPQPGQLNTYNFNDLGVEITLNSQFDETVDITGGGPALQFDSVASATAAAATFDFQVGNGTTVSDRITMSLPVVNLTQLGLASSNVTTVGSAAATRDALDLARGIVVTARSTLGASMNRLEIASSNIQAFMENSVYATSALLDVDVATEITELTTKQVLLEASVSMLSQANQQPQVLLGLLRG